VTRHYTKENPPPTEKVIAANIVPHQWGLWCSIENGKPFINDIETARWDEEDGSLWFLLGSFNFLNARPDEELHLVRIADPSRSATMVAQDVREHRALIAAGPPPPKKACPTCGAKS